MYRRILGTALAFGSLAAGCDNSGPLAALDAGSTPLPVAPAAIDRGPQLEAAAPPARVMPPRPVPTTSPTVKITMPIEVQLQAIQYMAAMQAPQPTDAPADLAYSKQIADSLVAVGKPDVISSGRVIKVVMAKGCDATLPRESLARRTGASLTTLLAHGVLVVSCHDHEIECVQSTRDENDVLCVHR
jgi:hypothetical protein